MFMSQTIDEGVRLHTLTTGKFKTVTIKVYVQSNLGVDTGLTALLPMVMSRGSSRLPTMQAISAHLATLYGTRFGCDVAKIGERHCIEFYFEMASSSYIHGASDLLDRGITTLIQLICEPKVEGNGFDLEYVAREKANLVNQINSLIDDKRHYALQRFYETMFVDEPFSTYKYGTVKEVEEITPQGLLQHYQKMMAQCPIDIFMVGDVQSTAVERHWEDGLGALRNGYRPLPAVESQPWPERVRRVQEDGDLQQGILFLGYRTPVTYRSSDYYRLLVYSGVLGGFPHSKLFVNVREKASLAYYAWARLEATKGFLMINAGIDPDNYEKAVEIILHQVDEINHGKVSKEELEATKRGLINGVLTMEDSAMAMIDRGIMGAINDVKRDTAEAIDSIRQVDLEDLVGQGRLLTLDTIYFLRGHQLGDPTTTQQGTRGGQH